MKHARLNDTGSHGGVITTASPDCIINGRGAARVGDTYSCLLHGPNPIVTGNSTVLINGMVAARIGSTTACGAVITSGSPDTEV